MKLLRLYLLLGFLLGPWAAAWAAPIVLDAHPRGLLLGETGQLQQCRSVKPERLFS